MINENENVRGLGSLRNVSHGIRLDAKTCGLGKYAQDPSKVKQSSVPYADRTRHAEVYLPELGVRIFKTTEGELPALRQYVNKHHGNILQVRSSMREIELGAKHRAKGV